LVPVLVSHGADDLGYDVASGIRQAKALNREHVTVVAGVDGRPATAGIGVEGLR